MNHEGRVPVGDNVLSSHGEEIYPTTSIDENCIEFYFQTNRNYYVDFRQTRLAIKLKFVDVRVYETYNTNEKKKSAKKRRRRMRKQRWRRSKRLQFLWLLIKTTLCAHFFPMSKFTSTISKFTIPMYCMRTSFKFPTTSRGRFLNTKSVCTARGTTMKNFLMKYSKHFVWTFSRRRKKMLSRPDGFMLYGKMGVDLFSSSEYEN